MLFGNGDVMMDCLIISGFVIGCFIVIGSVIWLFDWLFPGETKPEKLPKWFLIQNKPGFYTWYCVDHIKYITWDDERNILFIYYVDGSYTKIFDDDPNSTLPHESYVEFLKNIG
jgi:hypothetical protein